ncbi:MAG TPA: tyrosine-type recombinase/integrase [Polyangiaceae bacterium]|nr:tyrosine-type recombinase/integrase [Polyangiaceae bacterium]
MPAPARAAVRPPRAPTEQEQALLLRGTAERRADLRDHLLFALALGTGLREHEMVALDVGDVREPGGAVRRRVALRVFKGCRRDPAPQEVMLPEALRAKLAKFLRWKRARGEALAPDAPLFVSRKGGRLSTRQVRHLVGLWQARAGIERPFSAHSLRHGACTNMYRRTKDIRLTQRFARHASIVTTSRYTHTSDEALAQAVDSLPC